MRINLRWSTTFSSTCLASAASTTCMTGCEVNRAGIESIEAMLDESHFVDRLDSIAID